VLVFFLLLILLNLLNSVLFVNSSNFTKKLSVFVLLSTASTLLLVFSGFLLVLLYNLLSKLWIPYFSIHRTCSKKLSILIFKLMLFFFTATNSLYTNIKHGDALLYIGDLMKDKLDRSILQPRGFISLLDLVLKYNYFSFKSFKSWA